MKCCCSTVATVVSGVVILALGLSIPPIYNYVLHLEIEKAIPLRNTSKMMDAWEHPSVTSDAFIKFYFLDLVNEEDVKKGGKPTFVEKGPYYYDASKVKVDVKYEANGTVTYRAPRTMVFNPKLSVGREDDVITTINVPLYTVMSMLKGHPFYSKVFAVVLDTMKNETVFRQLTVKDLLWGYEDNLLMKIHQILKDLPFIHLPMPIDGKWGFFYKKNNSDTGLFNVDTGVNNLNDYMRIKSWNYGSHVPYWKTEECNRINGTDGEVYHPFVDEDEKMYIFIADLCRSIFLTYKEKVYLQGVPLLRFSPDPQLWMYDDAHAENQCFCVGDVCPHAGALNVSQCQGNAPVFVSQPHFLNGEYYRKLVDGLTANAALHNTYIDVEQVTGVVMEGVKRIQLNIAMEPIKNMPNRVSENATAAQFRSGGAASYVFPTPTTYTTKCQARKNLVVPFFMRRDTENLRTLLFPVFWLDQGAAINAVGMAKFQNSFFIYQKIVTGVRYGFVVLGSLLILVAVIIVTTREVRKRKSKPEELTEVGEHTPLLKDDAASSRSPRA